MAVYNIYEAKTHFSKLVESATRGEEVVIAKAGQPVLRLVPMEMAEIKKPRRNFGQGVTGHVALTKDAFDDLPLVMWEALREEKEPWD